MPQPTIDPAFAPRSSTGHSKASRLHLIAESVRSKGFVSVDTLSEDLGVSRMTVHRDLDELQSQQILRKVRGGASAERMSTFESDFEFRANAMNDEKRAIARTATELVNDGDVVVVGDSSTTAHVVPYLTELENITVITNFLPVIESVAAVPKISLITLGGQFSPQYRSFLGLLCERSLEHLYADVLFASASALLGTEVFHPDEPVVKVKQAMMRTARLRILMMDHTKFGHGALHRVGPVTDFTHVVVDDRADQKFVDQIRETGVEVLVASTGK